ncbi:unnamed protein product [Paramecium primaurelia]|uniref:beta-ketoacyl-[acyl-carrier-protein] synthase I n=1 Tax=Paramecium primaurelia TaxID=5886 RepID=A0A8S1MN41_PARPR|nr:unnamed protein product [Paramecium primaurelia]
MRRVVVTGMGMVSPLGLNVSESWNSLLTGKSGVVKVKDRNKDLPDVYMGLIPQSFDSKPYQVEYCPSNLTSYAMCAAQEAITDSSVLNDCDPDRIGVNIGVMNSSMTKITEIISNAALKGNSRINPFTMLYVLSNMPTALLTIKYKLKGPSSTASTACATGASAIGDSFRKIKYGDADVMIAGGTEDTFNTTAIYASIKMQAMSTKIYDDPTRASRPFDEDRSGFLLAEGSGILVLEEYERARRRGAKIYAEILGYGESSDAFHLTRPQDNGEGGKAAMLKAMKEAKINDVDLINCHATSTKGGDIAEARAIADSKAILVANKSQLGHTFGAAGAIESIFTIKSLQEQIVPPTINLDKPIIRDNQYCKEATERTLKYALKNAFGFGGVNVSLAFGKYN